MKETADIPILFIVFNRPNCVKITFETIRLQKPKRLFISADGPRKNKPGEIQLCEDCRSITNSIDWDCEVFTLYHDENIGCKNAVSKALKWFFTHVEYGIILEDDCVPDKSFFPYCKEMLHKYKDDERIGMVCGRNDFDLSEIYESYNFSTAGSIWGWATWKRVINLYDADNEELIIDFRKNIYNATLDKFERNRLFHQLKWVLDGSLNTWDYQLHVLLKLNSMLYIIPKVNLIRNIGFDENATHTTNNNEKRTSTEVTPLSFPLIAPRWMFPNRDLSKRLVRADSNKLIYWIKILVMKKIESFKNKMP
jgi:hypothetical protein